MLSALDPSFSGRFFPRLSVLSEFRTLFVTFWKQLLMFAQYYQKVGSFVFLHFALQSHQLDTDDLTSFIEGQLRCGRETRFYVVQYAVLLPESDYKVSGSLKRCRAAHGKICLCKSLVSNDRLLFLIRRIILLILNKKLLEDLDHQCMIFHFQNILQEYDRIETLVLWERGRENKKWICYLNVTASPQTDWSR